MWNSSPAMPAGETTISSRSPPKTASSAGANSTKVFGSPGVGRGDPASLGAGGGTECLPARANLCRAFLQRPRSRPPVGVGGAGAGCDRKRPASTPKQNCSACPATNCWAGKNPRPDPGLLVALRHLAHQSSPAWYKPPITDLDGVKAIGRESPREEIHRAEDPTSSPTMRASRRAGDRDFGAPFEPEINVDRRVLRDLRMHLEAIRDGAGPDVDIPARSQFQRQDRRLSQDPARHLPTSTCFWIEIDSFNPEALGYIRRQSPHPISSCETLLGLREFSALFPRTGDGCPRSLTHPGTACGNR